MSHRHLALPVPAAFISIALLAGCAGAPTKAAPPAAISLTEYSITAPTSLPASMATFTVTNSGKEAHQAALVRLDSGKTFNDFKTAMADTTQKGPPPAWIVWMGGAHAFPGAANDFTVSLDPGTYVWYCMIPGSDGVPHMMKGMSAAMTVTAASGAPAAAPASDIDVSTHDYAWDFSTPPTAGKHVLKISIASGSQPHEMALIRLAPGKKGKDFLDWAMKMAGPPPAEALYGVATMQPGQTNYIPVEFKAGDYAIICFVPDAKDGQPHAMHGMVKDFTIQ